MILGIDPGVHGAFCFMEDNGKVVKLIKMPLLDNKEIDRVRVKEIMLLMPIDLIAIELCRYTPKLVSAFTAFSFGVNIEIPHSIATTLGFPIEFIDPLKWKKYFNLFKKEKIESCVLVSKKYPELRSSVMKIIPTKVKPIYYDGVADAILITEFCRLSKKKENEKC